MEDGFASIVPIIVVVCFIVGGVSGAVVSGVMIEGPKAIDIPEGTLIVPENGEPYYYFESGIVITHQVFEVAIDNYENFVIVWPENYVPSSDNFVIVFRGWQDNYVIVPGENIVIAPEKYFPISVYIAGSEDVEWWTDNHRLSVEGWPSTIFVDWPAEGPYEYTITRVVMVTTNRIENRIGFTLRRSD